MTVVSDVPHAWASSVIVELATASGSSMTLWATLASAGGSDGSSERTRTTVLSGDAPAASAPSPDSGPTFLMAESFLRNLCDVNV